MLQKICLIISFITTSNGFLLPKSTSSSSRGLFMSMPGQTDDLPETLKAASMSDFRKMALPVLGGLSALLVQAAAYAAEETAAVVEPKVVLGPPPEDFGLKYDYYYDAGKVVSHMRYAVQMDKTSPKLVETATKVKEEMNEFVAYYRRFNGVNGRQSFSLLYTSINVLAGHYTSYGVKFPVPEKRRKRLLQEFNDIEKNIRKKR